MVVQQNVEAHRITHIFFPSFSCLPISLSFLFCHLMLSPKCYTLFYSDFSLSLSLSVCVYINIYIYIVLTFSRMWLSFRTYLCTAFGTVRL